VSVQKRLVETKRKKTQTPAHEENHHHQHLPTQIIIKLNLQVARFVAVFYSGKKKIKKVDMKVKTIATMNKKLRDQENKTFQVNIEFGLEFEDGSSGTIQVDVGKPPQEVPHLTWRAPGEPV
jgi:hypothetical protein